MSLLDRAITNGLKLPRAARPYQVVRDLRIPLRDGVELLADHYVPSGTPRGTLLVRSPYGRAGAFALLHARPFAARGFHVLMVSCRETFGSGGRRNAFAGEVEDGMDTVAWMRAQSWYTGSFGTLGVSYLGLTQWAIQVDPPEDLKAAVIVSGPHDTAQLMYGTGALALFSVAAWSDGQLHQEEHGPIRGLLDGARNGPKRIRPVVDSLPLGAAQQSVYGGKAWWYDEWLAHPDTDDPFWDGAKVTAALTRTEVPVLLVSGWHDLIVDQVVEQFEVLRGRGVDASLLLGPWSHGELASKAAGTIARESLAFFAEHLAGDGKRLSPAPVRIQVTGLGEWRDLTSWPPASVERVLFLHPGGVLGDAAVEGEPARFAYDPADPTPTVGGMTNAMTAGRKDNAALEERGDVLTWTGPVVTAPLEIAGNVVVELDHSSDNSHCDLFVRLCEVDAKGRSFNLCERFLRLPVDHTGPVRMELSPVAHVFRPGTRVRLQVSGGSHPMHDRNLGTGEPPATGSRRVPSYREIGQDGTSKVILPVVVGERSAGASAEAPG